MPTTDVTTWWLLLLMGVILLVCVVAPFLKDKMPSPPPEGNHPDCPGQLIIRFTEPDAELRQFDPIRTSNGVLVVPLDIFGRPCDRPILPIPRAA